MLHKHVLVLKFGLLAGLEKRDLLCSSQLNQEILRAVNVVTSGHNTSNSSSRRLNRTDIGLIGLILVEEIWCFGDLVQLWCSPFHSISFHFIPFLCSLDTRGHPQWRTHQRQAVAFRHVELQLIQCLRTKICHHRLVHVDLLWRMPLCPCHGINEAHVPRAWYSGLE